MCLPSISQKYFFLNNKVLPMPTSLLNTATAHEDAILQDRPVTGHRSETQRYFTAGLHEPAPTTRMQRFSERLWVFAESLRTAHVRFAFKTALAVLSIVIPAFMFPAFADIFEDYRLDWALVTVPFFFLLNRSGTSD